MAGLLARGSRCGHAGMAQPWTTASANSQQGTPSWAACQRLRVGLCKGWHSPPAHLQPAGSKAHLLLRGLPCCMWMDEMLLRRHTLRWSVGGANAHRGPEAACWLWPAPPRHMPALQASACPVSTWAVPRLASAQRQGRQRHRAQVCAQVASSSSRESCPALQHEPGPHRSQ